MNRALLASAALLLLLPAAGAVAKSTDRNQAMTIDSGSQSSCFTSSPRSFAPTSTIAFSSLSCQAPPVREVMSPMKRRRPSGRSS